METLQLNFTYYKKAESELIVSELQLLEAARQATYRSYSPYSHFSVGAAVLLADGTIVTGSNQENCSYPQGQCAERTAVFYANSRYPDQAVTMLCIAARGTDGQFTAAPVTPCGGCRQVLQETEQRQHSPIQIMLYGTDAIYIIPSAQLLLPLSFTIEH
ncbi:MAG: cytidine deaminase [Bacteroidaceae bacterium]|nr:cytidine deaminase [Bacteroidaceae bacterium]